MHWRNREKRNDQEHREKASFFSSNWVLDFFFLLLRKWPLHMFLVMLFIHVGKRLSSSSHIIFKTGVLKNFAIFTRKRLCWSLFLIKLQDWRLVFSLKETSTQVFSYEYCKIFKNSFFMENLFIKLFRKFMWWWTLDVWRLYFTTVKLGHVAERTSW